MSLTIRTLPPVARDSPPVVIAIKLNATILSHFKHCISHSTTPKLVVKNGNYSIKIDDNLSFPCVKIPENLNVDVYNSDCGYDGRLSTKLNAITDSKQIKSVTSSISEDEKARDTTASSAVSNGSNSSYSSSSSYSNSAATAHNIRSYGTTSSDTSADITTKFLNYLSLGPMSESNIVSTLGIQPSTFTKLIQDYANVYNPHDSFTSDDKFPVRGNSADDVKRYILKDRAYKELKPWLWRHYSDHERTLIIENIHHALTRLGYSETHPLRRKICENDSNNSNDDDDKKPSSLGGGFLISSKKNFRKSQTESPKMSTLKIEERASKKTGTSTAVNSPAINTTNNGSPQKRTSPLPSNKRKLSTSSSSSSSDEEKNSKRLKHEPYTSPSSEEIEDDSSGNISGSTVTSNISSSSNNSTSSVLRNTPRIRSNDSVPLPPSSTISTSKRMDYYTNLAMKFKFKYKEYETLYQKLKNATPAKSTDANKKALVKLFELHSQLSQWKKTLWDFDNEIKSKSNIMNLSKHKKSTLKSKGLSVEETRSNSVSPINLSLKTTSPAIGSINGTNLKFSRQSTPVLAGATLSAPKKPKMSLDY